MNEDAFASSDRFKETFLEVFGLSTQREQLTKGRLAYRAQGPDDDYIGYIEDVLALRKLASPAMSEADKVGHILKGMSEDGFPYLITVVHAQWKASHKHAVT